MYQGKNYRQGGLHIKKIAHYLVTLIVVMFVISFNTIESGGDGRSYSVKFNNETVCAYSNGRDDDKFYTISWDGEKITGTHELERDNVYKWYKLN